MSSQRDLSEEEDNRQSRLIAKLNALCKAYDPQGEGAVETMADLIAMLPGLTDPFYASAGRHSLINALCKAGLQDEAVVLFNEIAEDFIAKKALEDNPTLSRHPQIATQLRFDQLSALVREVRDKVAFTAQHDSEIPSLGNKLNQITEHMAALQRETQKASKKVAAMLWLIAVLLLIVIFK